MPLAQQIPARAAIILIAFFSALAVLLLSGCASGNRLVDSDVTAFTRWTAGPAKPGSSYRFERLPSQQPVLPLQPQQLPSTLASPVPLQDRVEAAAQTALARVGLVQSEGQSKAQFSVQVAFATQLVGPRYPYSPLDGYFGYGGGFFGGTGFAGSGVMLGGGSRGASIGLSFPLFYPFPERPEYLHGLLLVVRDLTSSQIVFETRAQHDSFGPNGLAVLPAMLEAALRGFPEPPAGSRRVTVEMVLPPAY